MTGSITACKYSSNPSSVMDNRRPPAFLKCLKAASLVTTFAATFEAAKASSDFIKEFRLFVGEDIATFQRHLDEVFIDVTTLEIKKRVENPCPEALASAQRLVESYRPIHELFHDAEKAKTSAELRHRLESAIQRVNSVTENLKRLSKYKKYLRRDVNIHEVMELFSKYSGKELEDQIILKFGTKGFQKRVKARKRKKVSNFVMVALIGGILGKHG